MSFLNAPKTPPTCKPLTVWGQALAVWDMLYKHTHTHIWEYINVQSHKNKIWIKIFYQGFLTNIALKTACGEKAPYFWIILKSKRADILKMVEDSSAHGSFPTYYVCIRWHVHICWYLKAYYTSGVPIHGSPPLEDAFDGTLEMGEIAVTQSVFKCSRFGHEAGNSVKGCCWKTSRWWNLTIPPQPQITVVQSHSDCAVVCPVPLSFGQPCSLSSSWCHGKLTFVWTRPGKSKRKSMLGPWRVSVPTTTDKLHCKRMGLY